MFGEHNEYYFPDEGMIVNDVISAINRNSICYRNPESPEYFYDENPESAMGMNYQQLLRSRILLDQLSEERFRLDIGNAVEADVADDLAEHGGLVVFNDKGALWLDRKNSMLDRNSMNNGFYSMPDEYYDNMYFVRYHIHAMKNDSSVYSGPSQPDMQSCDSAAQSDGESHSIVITKLAGHSFDVDYYSCIKNAGGKADFVVLDLGSYDY